MQIALYNINPCSSVATITMSIKVFENKSSIFVLQLVAGCRQDTRSDKQPGYIHHYLVIIKGHSYSMIVLWKDFVKVILCDSSELRFVAAHFTLWFWQPKLCSMAVNSCHKNYKI